MSLPSTAVADDPVGLPPSAVLFETTDLDHAREQIGRVYCPYRFEAGPVRPARASMHNLPGPHVGLSRFAYGADIVIDPQVFGDFVLVLSTLAGRARIRAGGLCHDGGAGCTVAVAHDVPSHYRYSADNVQLVARIGLARIEEVRRSLFGEPRSGRFALASHAFQGPRHARWLALLQSFRPLLDPVTPAPLRRLLLPRAEEMLITDLVWEQAAAGAGPERAGPAPACVRRAIECMEQHADEPLTLERIAAAAHCSVRTLQRSFQQSRGIAPMRHLKDIRLQRVRRDLLDAAQPASVTAAALRWGFAHAGQFAQEYRQAFGEKPSDTLRRRA